MHGGADADPATYTHKRLSFASTSSSSANGHGSPFPYYAPPSSASLSSFALARPALMHTPSPKPPTIRVSATSTKLGPGPAGPSLIRAGAKREEEDIDDDDDDEDSASLSASHSPRAPTPKKVRRTHARRSCLACRKRKARCELPDITVPSTMTPLQQALKCHRCRTLDADCIVWDGDRKMKGDRPARYGPPQDKLSTARSKSGSVPRTHDRASTTSKAEGGDSDSDSDVQSKKKFAMSPAITNNGHRHDFPSYIPRRKIIPFDPPPQNYYAQGVPNLRTIPLRPRTVEQCRANNQAISTAEVVDNISMWESMEMIVDSSKDSTQGPISYTGPSGSSASGMPVSLPAYTSDSLRSRTGQGSHNIPTSTAGRSGSRSRLSAPHPFATSFRPHPSGPKLESKDFKVKLLNATGRNAALMSEIIYGAPEYRARSRDSERIAYAYRGVPVVDEGTVPRDKVEALIRAHPFLSPELVETIAEDVDPASGRVFLSNVVNYLCLKPDPPPDLTSFLIRHSSIHVIMQTRNREVCQAMLLLVLYESTDMLLGKPAHDPDVQLDHVPGYHFYQAAMSCALSLGLDTVISEMCTGPDALTPTSSIEERMSRLRDAALWLTVSNMGVCHAFASERPQLPSQHPSLADFENYQAHIRPLLAATAADNERLSPRTGAHDGRHDVAPPEFTASHPPLTYQALAVSLSLIGQRAETVFRVRTLWSNVSAYDLCDVANITAISKLVLGMAAEVQYSQRRYVAAVEDLQEQVLISAASASADANGIIGGAANDPITSLLVRWAEIEALEVMIGLNARILFSIIATLAAQQGTISKVGAFKGLDSLDPHQAEAVFKLGEWSNWSSERILSLTSSLLTTGTAATSAHCGKSQGEDSNKSRPVTGEFHANANSQIALRHLHLIPPFQLCTVVFIAAKQVVEHELFASFGVGGLTPGCRATLEVLRRALRGLLTFAQGDRLSLPGIVANVLREFTRRYAILIKKGDEAASRKSKGGGINGPTGRRKSVMGRGGEKDSDAASSKKKQSVGIQSRFAQKYYLSCLEKRSGEEAGVPIAIMKNSTVKDTHTLSGEKGAGGERGISSRTAGVMAAAGEPNVEATKERSDGATSPIARLQHQGIRIRPDTHHTLNQQEQQQSQTSQQSLIQGSHLADRSQTSQPAIDYEFANELDLMFSATTDQRFSDSVNGGAPGNNAGFLSSTLGNYTHATLDHLLGSIEDEFMGFPLEDLLGMGAPGNATGSMDSSLTEGMPANWGAYGEGDLEAERTGGRYNPLGASKGSVPSGGYSTQHSHGSTLGTSYPNINSPHVTIGTTSGSSPYDGANSSTTGTTGSGLSIATMLSSRNGTFHQPDSSQSFSQGQSQGPLVTGPYSSLHTYPSMMGGGGQTGNDTVPLESPYGYLADGIKTMSGSPGAVLEGRAGGSGGGINPTYLPFGHDGYYPPQQQTYHPSGPPQYQHQHMSQQQHHHRQHQQQQQQQQQQYGQR